MTAQSSVPAPSVAVAICTRDRPACLRRALLSLTRQRRRPSEILVVDNAPRDDAAERVASEYSAATYLVEARAGLDIARNRALRAASSDVVAFLDDDAIAHGDWVDAIARTFEDPRVGACTGRVEAWTLETDAQRLFEANGGFGRGVERVRLPGDARRRLHGLPAPLIAWAMSVGSGCSLAVRTGLALELGAFDEALDTGRDLPGGGDLDMIWRVLLAGHHLVYEPEALAWHEHRRDMATVQDQIVGHQRAVTAFLRKSLRLAPWPQRIPVGTYLAWRLLKPGARLLRRMTGRDPLPAPLLLRMWRNCWQGVLAYPRHPRSHRP